MSDRFEGNQPGLQSPVTTIFEVTPDDFVDLPETTRCINVAATGAVRVTTIDGANGTIYVAAGIPFPLRASRIWATGTTATGIVGMV